MPSGQSSSLLLPPPGNTAGRGGRPERHSRQRILDAIFYLVRGGIAWRQLPHDFPPAMTVYDTYRRWVRSGAWQRTHDTSSIPQGMPRTDQGRVGQGCKDSPARKLTQPTSYGASEGICVSILSTSSGSTRSKRGPMR
ncbi:MAG: transposase [Dermatophilaceae bacterium]